MKIATTTRNGSPAKNTAQTALDAQYARRCAWEAEQKKLAGEAEIELTIKLRPFEYGMLCAAGVVHDLTPEQVLEEYLCQGDTLCEWSGNGCIFHDRFPEGE